MSECVNRLRITLLLVSIGVCSACQTDQPVPKPMGYFRIEVPEYSYLKKTPDCPFAFEVSSLTRVEYLEKPEEKCWFDIYYPLLKARMHMTYKSIDGDLAVHLEHARGMAFEHQIKASGIESKVINRGDTKVYGLSYALGGEVASPYQFYITDSVSHFLRGSLYFDAHPNADSIQPALALIRKDMNHFVESFQWK